MFGKKNHNPASEPDQPPRRAEADQPAPEGQAGYIPIDDIADFAGDAGTTTDAALTNLRAELDEVNDKWRRALADFQNYQRRALQNEQEARRQGVIAVLSSMIPVLDHFDVALSQKPADAQESGFLDGVKVIRSEMIKALESHGVRLINPQPNTEFDPNRHAAITHQPAEGVDPGRISAVFQPGYEIFDRVVRAAKVAVAP
ncbi:MAG: nucleotide exchange factor GrpE [Phycisphaerales bacterium]